MTAVDEDIEAAVCSFFIFIVGTDTNTLTTSSPEVNPKLKTYSPTNRIFKLVTEN